MTAASRGRLPLRHHGARACRGWFLRRVGLCVQRRTRGIGLRVGLGASPGLVMKSVLSRALALVACGLALGLVGALAGETMLRSLSEEGPGTGPVLVWRARAWRRPQ